MPSMTINPLLATDNPSHIDYVRKVLEAKEHFFQQTQSLWAKSLDWWDLFLAQQTDTRDPVDEQWRANLFVPLPFTTTRTKSAQLVEHLANQDPVWQVTATRESGPFYEQSKHYERLLQYTAEHNTIRKFMTKMTTARSVQGTAFMKAVWTKRAHRVTVYPSQDDYAKFVSALMQAQTLGAPPFPDYQAEPEKFEQQRQLVNKAERFGYVPAAPMAGPIESIEYVGPLFQYVPMWQIYLDPLVDEIADQKFIIHRMVKPLNYVLARADDLPPGESDKPFYLPNVEAAMAGWDGQVLQEEENELAEAMGLDPRAEEHPYFQQAVEILEVWSPEEDYKFATIMNQKYVINKIPDEYPLLTYSPNIFALRNIMVPGHFYGLSDYQEAESLFRELNKFRNLRQDGATLATLPVFVKQAGVALGDALRKLRPGMVLSVPGAAQAVTQLIRHQVPAEAYREPPELKEEISDATEVPPYLKGAQADLNRVTGTEFQGRAANIQLKTKVDASFVEDELKMLPPTILSFFALMEGDVRREIGGDPDAVVDLPKSDLIKGLGMRFRFRGATRSVDPALQTQQLIQAFLQFQDVMTPAERRFGLQLVMEMMDIRGWSKAITSEGTQQIAGSAGIAQGAADAQNQQATDEAQAQGQAAPGSVQQPAPAAPGGGEGGAGGPA